ncbi:MAG: hypothetical protein ACXADH_04325, partial [Candidatus Kariarchaeaceae archaeon]
MDSLRDSTVPALLTPGEFVIKKDAAKAIGSSRLNRLNKADKFAMGGRVEKYAAGGFVQRFQGGGDVQRFQGGDEVQPAQAAPSVDVSALIFGLSALASTVSDTDSVFGQFSQVALGAVSTFTILNGAINAVGPSLSTWVGGLGQSSAANQQNTVTTQQNTAASQQNTVTTTQSTVAVQQSISAAQQSANAYLGVTSSTQQSTAAAQQNTAAAQQNTVTTQQNTAAEQQSTAAEQQSTAAAQQSVNAYLGITSSAKQNTVATQQSTTAEQKSVSAAQQSANAYLGASNAAQKNAAASEQSANAETSETVADTKEAAASEKAATASSKGAKAQTVVVGAVALASAALNAYSQSQRKAANELAQNATKLADIDKAAALGEQADIFGGAATGVQTGALVGGIVGAFGGPAGIAIGTAIGAAAGGVIGAVVGGLEDDDTSDEARTARQSVFNSAVENFSNSVQEFEQGVLNQEQLGAKFEEFTRLQNAILSTTDTEQRAGLQRQAQQQLPQLRKLAQDASKASDSFTAFEQQFGGQGAELIATISAISGTPLITLRNQIESNIEARNKLNEVNAEALQAEAALIAAANQLGNLNAAIANSTASLQQFSSSVTSIIDRDIAGQAQSAGFTGSVDLQQTLDRILRGQQVDPNTVQNVLGDALRGFEPELKQNLTDQVQAVSRTQQQLPDLLQQAQSRASIQGSKIEDAFEELVESAFPDDVSGAQGRINDLIIARFRKAAGGGAGQSDIVSGIENNPEDVAKKILNATDKGVVKALIEYEKVVLAGANELAKAFDTQIKATQRVAGERLKLAKLEIQAQAAIAQARQREGGELQRARAGVQGQLQVLGAGGRDSGDIVAELRDTIAERNRVDERRQELRPGDVGFETVNAEFVQLSSKAVNLRKALELLAGDTTRLSAAQKELQKLQSQRDTRRNFVTQAIFGDREQRRQTVRQIGAVGAVAETGNIDDIRGDLRQDVLSFLSTFKDQQLAIFRDAQGGERTGEDIINQVIENFARTQARNADEAKDLEKIFKEQILGPTTAEEKLQTEVADFARQQVAAQNQVVQELQRQQQALDQAIPNAIERAAKEQTAALLGATLEQQKREEGQAGKQVETAVAREGAARTLQGFGFEDAQQASTFATQGGTEDIKTIQAVNDTFKKLDDNSIAIANKFRELAATSTDQELGDFGKIIQKSLAAGEIKETLDQPDIDAIRKVFQERLSEFDTPTLDVSQRVTRTVGGGLEASVDVEVLRKLPLTIEQAVKKLAEGREALRTGKTQEGAALSAQQKSDIKLQIEQIEAQLPKAQQDEIVRRSAASFNAREELISRVRSRAEEQREPAQARLARRAAAQGIDTERLQTPEGLQSFQESVNTLQGVDASFEQLTQQTDEAEASFIQLREAVNTTKSQISDLGTEIANLNTQRGGPDVAPVAQQGAGQGFLGRLADLLGFNQGGLVPGAGNRDTVPAALTPGEFVLRKSAVNSIGLSNLQQLNQTGVVPGFQFGGAVNALNLLGVTKESAGNFIDNFKTKFNTGETLEAFVGEDGARIVRGVANFAGVSLQNAKQVLDAAQAEAGRRE